MKSPTHMRGLPPPDDDPVAGWYRRRLDSHCHSICGFVFARADLGLLKSVERDVSCETCLGIIAMAYVHDE